MKTLTIKHEHIKHASALLKKYGKRLNKNWSGITENNLNDSINRLRELVKTEFPTYGKNWLIANSAIRMMKKIKVEKP